MTRPVGAVCATACMVMLGFSAGCKSDPDPLEHGFVKLELRAAVSQSASPFPGTTTILASMIYEECLRDFYEVMSNYRADGPDGEPAFGSLEEGGEGWRDRLCDDPAGGQVDCDIAAIDQSFQLAPKLTVTYNVRGDITNRFLKFGPLPTAELADCQGSLAPQVADPSVNGEDGEGTRLWITAATSASIATTNQGGEIVIRAERL